MTKSELLESTKIELVKMAKKTFGLALKSSRKKMEMVAEILKTAKKAAKKSAKKVPAKLLKKTIKKKSAVKAVTKISNTKKTATPKKTIKVAPKKTLKTAKRKKSVARTAKVTNKQTKVAATEQITSSGIYENGRSAEEKMHEAKFYVAQAQEDFKPAPESAIRERFEDNRIVILVRDPFWIFAFWDLHDDTRNQTARRHGLNDKNSWLNLRVYDITGIDFDGANANSFFDIGVGSVHGNWYVKIPKDGRTYCVDVGLKTDAGVFHLIARSNFVAVPLAGVATRIDEEWVVIDEKFWKIYALSGGFEPGQAVSSAELQAQMQKRFARELASGSVSSLGGSETVVKKPSNGFRFKLECELIVYGATEPDARVTLGGKAVPLRPDGTFTARFALPDGIRALPAVATSADMKFEKTITPTVSRSTVAFENVNEEEVA